MPASSNSTVGQLHILACSARLRIVLECSPAAVLLSMQNFPCGKATIILLKIKLLGGNKALAVFHPHALLPRLAAATWTLDAHKKHNRG